MTDCKECERLKGELAQANGHLKQSRSENAFMSGTIIRLKTELAQAKAENARLSALHDELNSGIKWAKEHLEETQILLHSTSDARDKVEAELAEYKAEIALLRGDLLKWADACASRLGIVLPMTPMVKALDDELDRINDDKPTVPKKDKPWK